MIIDEPAGADDGYSKGLHVLRNTTAVSGGTPGNVNTASCVESTVGKDVTAFEWAHLALLHNYADKGENCASYVQGNKHGEGGTWAQCVEVCDVTPGDTAGLVGQEVDVWCAGPDNGLRFGQDILVGDGPQIRGLPTSGVAEGTAAVRIGTTTMSPHARWKNGIQMYGNVDCLFDLSQVKCQQIFKLPAGMSLAEKPDLRLTYAAFALSLAAFVAVWFK